MAEYSVGASGGDFQDTVRRAQAASGSIDELNRKEEQRRASEERTAGTEQRSAGVRTGLAGATNELTSALERNVGALNAETAALERNLGIMQRSIELRRQMASGAIAGGRGGAGATGAVAADAGLAEIQRVNAALAQRTAEMSRFAQESERAMANLRISAASAPGLSAEAQGYLATQTRLAAHTSQTDALRAAGYTGTLAQAPSDRRQLPQFASTFGGPSSPVHPPTQEEADYREQVRQNESDLRRLSATQRDASQAFNEAGAAYAQSSQALSRHGALTTEFIQAFARGQVTLKEFESQMLSTIGKFGGWAIAGGAVYGVFKLFEDLKNGAVETQAAVQQLGRFIPGLGGPAGGGTSQVGAVQSTVRDISTQFNVPIKDVVDNMQVMARVFHNVADAGEATRAVLAVARLDQVPAAQAQQYLIGISQSTGLTRGSDLVGVVNSLNALQAQYGARVSQTLPAIARAAPAAVASGTDLPTLEALASLGVRAGLPGAQVGTALLRSQGTFAFRPASQLTFREFGLQPQVGDYGGLIRQVFGLIDERQREGRPLSGPALNKLAQGLGGPLLGSRSILPLLVQEQLHPGLFQGLVGTAQRPRSYQEDLNQVLGTITERFKSIGIALQNFGGMLAQAGVLTPITALFDAFTLLVHVTEALAGPLLTLGNVVNQLPGPLKDLLGVLVAFRAARALYNTTFGGAAQSFVGRLPGLTTLRNQPREAVEGTQARLETYLVPDARNEEEAANRALQRARAQEQAARRNVELLQANAPTPGTPEARAYEGNLAAAIQRQQQAAERSRPGGAVEQRAQEATANLANLQGDLTIIKDKQVSFADRAAYLEQQGYIAQQATIDIQERILLAKRAQLETIRGGGAAAAAGGGVGGAAAFDAAALAAGAGVAASAAAESLSRDPQALGDLQQTSRQIAFPGLAQRPRPSEEIPVAPYQTPRAEPITPAGMAAVTRAAVTENEAQRARYGRGEPYGFGGFGGLTGTSAVDKLASATSRMSEVVGSGALPIAAGIGVQNAASRARDMLMGPGAPIAGLIGSQLIGDAIGGNVGNYVSGVGGAAFSGMLISQMLGKGNPLLGLAAGATLGNFQQSTSAGVGSLIGGAAGAALGTLLPIPGLGTISGAAIGSVLGGVLGQIIGGGGDQAQQLTGPDIQSQGTINAAALISRAQQAGPQGAGARGSLASQVSSDLHDALYSTGTNAQQAQANIQGVLKNLTGQVQLFGGGSQQGRTAQQLMSQIIIPAAVEQASVDPGTAQQLVETVTQARNQEIQRQLQYNIAQGTGPGSGGAAAAQAGAQYRQVAAPFGQAAADLQGQVADGTTELAQLRQREAGATGQQRAQLSKQVQAAQHNLDGLKQQASAAKAIARLADQNATLQEQAAAQAGYQADVQTIQAQTGLRVAQAGGDVMRQLQAQSKGAQESLQAARSSHLDPRTQANEVAKYQAQLIDARNKVIQEQFGRLQARGAVAEASTPIGDTQAEAEQKYRDMAQQYQFMTHHRQAFDPKQIQDFLAQVITARKNALEAGAQYQTQLSDIRTQIQQAEDFGNALAQSNDAVAGAARDLKLAVTPQEKLQARAKLLDAQNQQYQAQQQTIQSQGELQAALAQGNPLEVAAVNVQTARSLLANARGVDNVRTAEITLANAQYAYNQAQFQRIQTLAGVQEAQAQGDPVQVARIALNAAQQEMNSAHSWEQQMQAQKDLADAQYQMSQALQQQDTSVAELEASTTVDPLTKLRDQIQGAVKALRDARGPSNTRQAQTNLNNLRNQYHQSYIDQTEATIQFQFDMMEITAQQALAQLRALLKLPGLAIQKRQQILEEIRRFELGQVQPLGAQGGFDLAPGNIRLPTYYDVGAAIRGRPVAGHGVSAYAQTQINVYVRRGADVPKVADAIDRVTTGHLRQKLRAAGVR